MTRNKGSVLLHAFESINHLSITDFLVMYYVLTNFETQVRFLVQSHWNPQKSSQIIVETAHWSSYPRNVLNS